MEKNNQNMDINSKISLVLSKITDEKIYSNIMQELFCNGLGNPIKFIDSLNILPKLNSNQIKDNFLRNIRLIVSKIKDIIKTPYNDIYKILSCIYGAFLGDAIGAFCEFEEPKDNSKNIFSTSYTVIGGVPGQVTDDSEMALSLAYAIMDNPKKEELLVDYIYFYYGAWFKTDPLDYGNTTKHALKDFDFIKNAPYLQNFKNIETNIIKGNYDSLSNGFLMRKSPFIAWLYYRFYNEINTTFSTIGNNNIFILNLYKKIKDLSIPDNRCTNPNEHTNVVSSIYCLMALMAIKGLNANYIKYNITNLCKDNSFNSLGNNEQIVSQNILYYFQLFSTPNFNFNHAFVKSAENVYDNMGYYLHALKLTLYFIDQFEYIEPKSPQKKYRTIMNQICDLGGDTDTNCCIVGAVIGPLIGMNNFGKEFNTMIELIPPNRAIYSVSMIILFIIYLNKSNKDENLVKNDKYFLKQIFTMLYGDIDLDY